jgi:hypothetical protein
VKAAAETFRKNPKLDTVTAITELGKGEALVSFLEGNGTPAVVSRCLVPPPTARVGAITPEERQAVMAESSICGKYDNPVDPESAYEVLQRRVAESATTEEAPQGGGGLLGGIGGLLGGLFGTNRPRGQRLSTTQIIAREVTRSVTSRVIGKIAADIGRSVGGSMGGSVGRAIVRGTLGGLLRR